MARELRLSLMADLSAALEGCQPTSISVGPHGEALLLLVRVGDAPLVQGYEEQPSGVQVPSSRTPALVAATVLIHTGQALSHVPLHDLAVAHPTIQLLPGNELLVVGRRCERFADGTAEQNAQIYGADGALRRTATFGDGILDVQTTTQGDIWVSYFDEGVYGSGGWGRDEASTPIGTSGLVRFDSQGALLWAYEAPPGIGPIDDCYALNVSDDAVWAYYYADFPLIRIGRDGVVRAWRTTVSGAGAFAVAGTHVLFFGGYRSRRTRCLLGELRGEHVTGMIECQLVLPSGEPLPDGIVLGRGERLHVFSGTEWLSVHLPTVLLSSAWTVPLLPPAQR